MTDRAGGGEETPAVTDGSTPGLSQNDAWGMVSTLVAGPVVWGLIGAGVDHLLGTTRVFLAIGLVVGFLASFYITYVRYGRS